MPSGRHMRAQHFLTTLPVEALVQSAHAPFLGTAVCARGYQAHPAALWGSRCYLFGIPSGVVEGTCEE